MTASATVAKHLVHIDSAGANVIYFPNGTYKLGSMVTVRGSVCALKTFGAHFSAATSGAYHMFHVQNTSCPSGTVILDNITNDGVFSFPEIDNDSTGTVLVRDTRLVSYSTSSGHTGGGRIFIEDGSFGAYNFIGVQAWGKQLNPEAGPSNPKITCNNSTLWVLGLKTENPGGGSTPSAVLNASNSCSAVIYGGYVGTQQQSGDVTGDPMLLLDCNSSVKSFFVGDFHNWSPVLRVVCGGNTDTNASSFPQRGCTNPCPSYWFANTGGGGSPPPLTPGNYFLFDAASLAMDAGFFVSFGPIAREYTLQPAPYPNQTWVFAASGAKFTIYNTSIGVCLVNSAGVPTMVQEAQAACTNQWTVNPVAGGYTVQEPGNLYLNSPQMLNGALTLGASAQTFSIQ